MNPHRNASPVDWPVFATTVATLVAVALPLMIWPQAGGELVGRLYGFLTARFGIAYLWVGIGTLGFVLWIAFGRYGGVRLGAGPPAFSTLSWVAMLFCAGVATGIFYWGTTEWAYYYDAPPYGAEPRSTEAIEWASTYGMFHWGFIGWALYCLPAVAIGHAHYVRGRHQLRPSTACEGLLGRQVDGPVGRLVNALAIVGLLGAAGTSLGFGTPMIAAAFGRLSGVPPSFALQAGIVLLCALLFCVSVYLGIDRGIRRLSHVNLVLTKALLLFVLMAGPTLFILKMATNSAGLYLARFVRMSTWTEPLGDSRFVEDWTVFYWAWYIAAGPFFGIFFARISEGRTLRQLVLGMLGWGSLGCALYYAVLGNYALHLELNEILSVTTLLADQGPPAAIAAVFASLPYGGAVLGLFSIASLVFLATTYDSAAYSLASGASTALDHDQEPATWHRLFWAFALALLPLVLMRIGGLDPMRTASLVASLPLAALYVVMAASLVRALRAGGASSMA